MKRVVCQIAHGQRDHFWSIVWAQLENVLLHVFNHRTLSLHDLLKEEVETRILRAKWRAHQ